MDVFDQVLADRKAKPRSRDVFDEVLAERTAARPVAKPAPVKKLESPEPGFFSDERSPNLASALDIIRGTGAPKSKAGAAVTGAVENILPSLNPQDFFEGPARLITDPVDSLRLLGGAAVEGAVQQAGRALGPEAESLIENAAQDPNLASAAMKMGAATLFGGRKLLTDVGRDLETLPERMREKQSQPLLEKVKDAAVSSITGPLGPAKELLPDTVANVGNLGLAPLPFVGSQIGGLAEAVNDPVASDVEKVRARSGLGALGVSALFGSRAVPRKAALKNYVDASLEAATKKGEAFDRAAVEKAAGQMSPEQLSAATDALRRPAEPEPVKAAPDGVNQATAEMPAPKPSVDVLSSGEVVGYNAKDGKPIVRIPDSPEAKPAAPAKVTRPTPEAERPTLSQEPGATIRTMQGEASLGLPEDLKADIDLIRQDRLWQKAVTTKDSTVTLADGTPGVVVRPASNPMGGGTAAKVLVEHDLDGRKVQRSYSALELDHAGPVKQPTFTTGDQPGANYTSEQLRALKEKNNIVDEPRQMVGDSAAARQLDDNIKQSGAELSRGKPSPEFAEKIGQSRDVNLAPEVAARLKAASKDMPTYQREYFTRSLQSALEAWREKLGDARFAAALKKLDESVETSSSTDAKMKTTRTRNYPDGFDSDRLYVKIPDDGHFLVRNNPHSIDRAIKGASAAFAPLKAPGMRKQVARSPREFDNAKYIAGLEKEIATLERGGAVDPYTLEQLKAARENLAEAKAVQIPAGRSAEAGFIRPDALLPRLGSVKEAPPVSENLRAIRQAQQRKVIKPTPELPPVQKVVASVPEYARKVTRNLYDRFSEWRRVEKELRDRGIELAPEESPDHVLDIVYGGTGGKLQAEAIEMRRVVDEASKLGLKGDLADFLNLSGYRRAFNVLESRRAAAQARFERETADARKGNASAGARAAEAGREVAAIDARIRNGQVVPKYLSVADIETDLGALREIRGEKKFRQIRELADKVFDLNQRAWTAAYESGIIAKSTYERGLERGKEYIPLERIMEEVGSGSGPAFASAVNLDLKNQRIFRKFEGSSLYNKNPFSASLKRIFETYREVEKNRAAKVAVGALLKDKQGYAKDVLLVERRKVDYFKAKQEGEPVALKMPADKEGISFYENGEKVTYAVPRLLAESLNVANTHLATGEIAGVLKATRDVFRAGATGKNLAFILKNVPRDIIDLHLMSKASAGLNPIEHAKFAYAWLESFGDALRHNDRYLDFLRSGAANATLQKQITPETFLRLNSLAEKHGAFGTILDTPGKVLDQVAKLNSATEEATKITGLKILKKRGVGDVEAAVETRRYAGSPDFARRGSGARDLDLAFMFANVGIQGTARLFKRTAGFGTNPTLWAGASAATLALYANNAQYVDEKGVRDIDRVPDYQKRNNWVILRPETYRTDDGVVRHKAWLVPKPQGSRLIFNGLEHVADAAVTGKGDAAQSALDAFSDLLPGQFNLKKGEIGKTAGLGILSSANPVAKAPIEWFGNFDSFSGTPVVPRRMLDLPAQEQKRLLTSPTAVQIGEAINQSPLKIEHAIRTFLGGLGEQALAVADLAQPAKRKLERLEGDQLTAARPLLGIFARGFVGSAADQTERDAANKFYDYYGKSKDAMERFNVLKKRNRDEAREFLTDPENRALAASHAGLQKTVMVLGKIRRLEEQIERGEFSPEDARKKLAFLREKRMDAYKQGDRVERLLEMNSKKRPVVGILNLGGLGREPGRIGP